MSPLAQRTIATIGSGVMAEAIIAGLLRGRLVDPTQVVASHPRAERRDQLAAAHGIRTTAANVDAISGADIVILAIKPQMLARVGSEIGSSLKPGQLVLSVLAGATTKALKIALRHDQIVRSMPNTPARLGKGMTVWFATAQVTAEQRAQAAALLSALGVQLEVDDEKLVAMATAVSGTGPLVPLMPASQLPSDFWARRNMFVPSLYQSWSPNFGMRPIMPPRSRPYM